MSLSVPHLAGIIPVAGQPLDFNFPWHDCLQPISKNYLAVERSVVECAYAGCKTIWIVCHDEMQPLIRYRLGDFVQDPVYLYRTMDPGPIENSRRQIPIQYVPIHPKDRDKRDCLGWSVLYGAMAAYYTSHQVSKWVTPDMHFVSFPYGVYDPAILREHRKDISSDKNFFLSFEGKTIKDGEYLSFTFNKEQFVEYRRELRKNATGQYKSGTQPGEIPKDMLPIEKRWSARYFSLDNVFGSVILDDAKVVETPWYFGIDNWDSLRQYLGSDKQVERPHKDMLSYHEFNRIGEFVDEDQ
jgi:hypothetical protein